MTTPYVTATDMRLYLDKVPTGTTQDDLLDTIGVRATDMVDTYLGFSFDGYTSATTKTVYGGGTPYLYLPTHEVGSVTAIVPEGGTAIGTTTWAEEPDGRIYLTGAYQPYPEPYASQRFTAGWGFYRYTVTGNWGYGDVPEAVKEVALEIAVNIFRSKDKGLYTDVIGVEGSGGIRYIGGLTNQQREVLHKIRSKYQSTVVFA